MPKVNAVAKKIIANVEKVIIGKRQEVILALMSTFAEGHILLEDVPGVAKTMLARAISLSFGCDFKRIQCTPDLLPSDITGASIFNPKTTEFEFRAGPLFTSVLLADEINRTTPRTQSALLEAMNERQVSIEGTTHALAPPFFVLATQNPFEFEGTFPLPENQLDRFMLCISIGYPDSGVEQDILRHHRNGEPVDALEPVLETAQLEELQRTVRAVRVDDSISEYLLKIVTATREHPELTLGVSTRGALTLYRAAQSRAMMENRDFVTPDDVKELAVHVLAHRVMPRGLVREGQRERARVVIRQILDNTRVPT